MQLRKLTFSLFNEIFMLRKFGAIRYCLTNCKIKSSWQKSLTNEFGHKDIESRTIHQIYQTSCYVVANAEVKI